MLGGTCHLGQLVQEGFEQEVRVLYWLFVC